jgi:DNA (cytosine-5)-methyltransferase 1
MTHDRPFEFHQRDALAFLREVLADARHMGFDVVHASPPCKLVTVANRVSRSRHASLFEPHPDLIAPTLDLLAGCGLPWVVENVPGAPMPNPVTYCGSSFGLRVRRHRLFSSNVPLSPPACNHAAQGQPVGVYGNGGAWTRTAPGGGGVKVAGKEAADALGVDWTDHQPNLSQMIPPAYTEHIGRQILEHLERERAA